MDVPLAWLCFLLFYFTTSLADPKCHTTCKGAGGPFQPGNVYKYQFSGESQTKIPGSPNDVTTLGISATAEIFAESQCQHVLKLSNVQVKGPDGKSYDGLNADCVKPVKFSYSDGKLEGICGEEDDRGAGLNIKRAVISLLSAAKKQESGSENGYESDVFGICPTTFSFSSEGSKLTIKKSKLLNRCALREEFLFPFPSTPYQAIQSSFGAFETSPLLKGVLEVEQELDGATKVLEKANGLETYEYAPLANQEARVTVVISSSLVLQGSSPGSIPANVNSPKSLFYEVEHDADGVKNHDKISAALQEAVGALDPVATPEAAPAFANLVHLIEQGSKADILQVYNTAQGKTAKDLFLDGLLYAGSADSVEAAAELLSTKKIPEESALRWYLDLHFVKHASRGSLTSLVPLLSKDKVPHQAYLGIGAVAGKFCLEHQPLCQSSPEYKTLVSQLAAPLAGGCKADSHDKENTIIASLKGLRNTRHLPEDIAQKISLCATDKTVKTRVRVAAIEAFHADASKPVLKEAAKLVLKDVDEDSELRIKAYLALVESPCPKVADTVKELIDNEPINQVGSFIVSHLRNLRASVSPEKEAAKEVLGNIIAKKKYPFDERKFSKNHEVSYSLDALNVGAVGEVNRIFSQKSFIPRSVSLNLTTQLFGHSVNLAEIGLRAENLERIFEKYFGPKGLVKTKGPALFDVVADHTEDAITRAKEKVEAHREKRSASKQQADSIKIDLGPDYEDLHTNLDLSLKIFGSDIAWLNYYHDSWNPDGMKKKLQSKLDETLDKYKSIDIDYKKARQFLDVGVTYPTGLGFGLKVKVNGNSAVNFKVDGKLDVKAILKEPEQSHIAFQLVPSASVELKSVFSVDASVVESGLKVSARLHSSTGSDLTVKLLQGYGVDVKLGLPVKTQELLNFHTDVVSIVKERKAPEVEHPIKFNVKREEHGGCFDQLSALTGLTFCGEFSIPMDGLRVISPAYGPSKAALRIEKDDESLTTYHFKAFYNNKEPNKISAEVLLDTPNSKTNRKFALNVQASNQPQKQILVNLVSPFQSATFEGKIIDTEVEQAVAAHLVADGAEYSFKIGAHVSQDGNRKKYEPLLEYKYPESAKPDRAWLGRKGAAKGGKQQSSMGVTGAVFVEKSPDSAYRKYELKSVTLTTPKAKLTVDGIITIDDNLFATDLKATIDKDSFVLNSKIQKLAEHKYIAKIEFLPSQYPDVGGSIKWEYERSPHEIKHNLVVVHGPDLKSETHRLSLTQLFKYDPSFYTENTVSYPLLGVSATLKGGATSKSISYDFDVTYEQTQVKSKLDAKVGGKTSVDYNVNFEAAAFGNAIYFTSKHDRVTETKSKFTNSLELKPGGKYSLNVLADYKSKPGDFHQSLDAEFKLPRDPKIVKLKTELKHNNKEFEAEFDLIAGNKHVISFEAELKKSSEPTGKFKLSLQKLVDSQGSFETAQGKSSGSFFVNVLKTGRKIEGNGEVTDTGKHFKGSANLLWDAKKDPLKKLHIQTDTSCDGKTIDSKNILQVLDYKTEVNFKGNLDGSLTHGVLIGDAEVVLPNGRVIQGKVNRKLHLAEKDRNIDGTWEILDYESRGANPRKWTVNVVGKNMNPYEHRFDVQTGFKYVSTSNEDIELVLHGKKLPTGDKWTIAGEGSLKGSLVKFPLETKFAAEVSDLLLKGKLAPDNKFPPSHYEFGLKTKNEPILHLSGEIKPDRFYKNTLELNLPASLEGDGVDMPIKSFKWETLGDGNLFISDQADTKFSATNAVHWNNDKFIKSTINYIEDDKTVFGRVIWESHEISLRTLTFKGHVDEKAEKADVDVTLEWEGKKADLKANIVGTDNPISFSISSSVPDGKYHLDVHHQESGETKETKINASANEKKVAYSSKITNSATSPSIDVALQLPQGTYSYHGAVTRKGPDHRLVDIKIKLGQEHFDLDGEYNIKSIEDFFVKLNLDSPNLGFKKLNFEAATKQATKTKSAGGNTITFHGKNGDKEFTGSLSLASKGEKPNLHYEGNGVVQIGDKHNTFDFKLKSLEEDKHKEMTFEGKFNKDSYSAQTTIENDADKLVTVKSWYKYCNEGNECVSDEYNASYKRDGIYREYSSELKVELLPQLIALASDHPIIIKNHLKGEGLFYDRGSSIEYGPKKIQYHEYFSKDNSGFELVLPKRTIAAEIVHEFQAKNPIKSKIEASFWLDKKNKAEEKTCFLLLSENTEFPTGHALSSVASFNSPGLKELALKSDLSINTKDHVLIAKLEADVFAKKNQKLVVDYKAAAKKDKDTYSATGSLHIHSKGLNIEAAAESKSVIESKISYSYTLNAHYINSKQVKQEGVVKFAVDRKSLIALVKLPEGIVYSADLAVKKDKDKLHAKGKYEILGLKLEEEVDIKRNQFLFSVEQTSGTDHPKLQFGASYVSGQVAELQAKLNNKPLAGIEVALDDAHFLKAKHNYNTDAAKELVKHIKDNHLAILKEGSRIVKETGANIAHEISDRSEECRIAMVHFKPAVQHYQKELDEFKEEIKSNKDINEIITNLDNTFGTLFKQIQAIWLEIYDTIHRLHTIFDETLKKTNESVKAMIPKLKKLYEEAFEILVTQYKAFLDFATTIIDSVLDKIKEHEKDIDELTSVVTDSLREVSEVVLKTAGDLNKEIKEFIHVLWEQIQGQAAFTVIKEKLQELKDFKIPDQYWETYHELVATVEQALPTPELQHLFKTITELLEKILKKEAIDKSQALQLLYNEFVASVRSVIAILEAHKTGDRERPDLPISVLFPVPSYGLLFAPPGTFRFSLLNWVKSSDLPTLSDLFHTYRPLHSPLDIIPPFKATALLMGGTEFITFDKKHYSFKGSCSYLLSKDIIDKNFTIVANMEAGKLKSISVFDHENSIELLHDDKVLVNGKPAEFPVHVGHLATWKKYDRGTGFATCSGLMFFCTPHLQTCAFTINGYYFGKTRGLLGTYNYEPYDDAVSPSGIIAKSNSEFANSWKVTPSCPDVSVPDQPAPPAEECSKLFAADSSLRNCFHFQNPDIFREACNKQVAGASGEAKEEKACNIALSYVGYCYYVHLVPGVKLPDHCGKCKVGAESLQIGESTQIKTPQNSADIVFVVEQLKENEEVFKNLITPLIPTLTNDLKEKGITDVKFALIGYGAPEQHWPAIYTFNGKYNEFTGSSENIYFAEKKAVDDPKFSDKIKKLKEVFQVETGTSKAANAYEEAFDYPFRPEALRTIIGVYGEYNCQKASFALQKMNMFAYQILASLSNINVNIIVPLEDIEIEGKDEKTNANIVGFDRYAVYTQGEAKRKTLKGDYEALKSLHYREDPCIEHTLDSDGAVFSSSNFIKGKPQLRKNFLQVVSSKITEDMTREELTRECKCVLEKGMVPRTKCRVVGQEKKSEALTATKGGVKGVKG